MATAESSAARVACVERADRIWRQLLNPPPRLTLSEWADEHRVLSGEAAAEPGPWRTDRVPYLRGLMDTISDPDVRHVVWVAASQVGKTEVLNNGVGYAIHHDPGPILIVNYSLEVGQTWSKDRFAPMIRDTPVLRGRVGDPRSRDSGNTILHKALDVDTPIPTPVGWTTMAHIQAGDVVFDDCGKPTTVTHVTPVQHGRLCYRVTFCDGSSIVTDQEHPWYVERWRTKKAAGRKPWSEAVGEIVSTGGLAQKTPGGFGRRHPYSIPVADPIETADADLALDPYVLGVWIGNGLSHRGWISSGYEDADEMADLLRRCGCTVHRRATRSAAILVLDRQRSARNERTGQFEPSSDGVTAALRSLGILGTVGDSRKSIPAEYLRASVDQRIALLQGLMDTDGHIRPKDSLCVFVTVRPHVAEQVRELVVSLGIRASVTRQESWLVEGSKRSRKKDSYRVTFRAPAHLDVFRIRRKLAVQQSAPAPSLRATRRKVVSVEEVESVPVRCIAVDSPGHLYLAGSSMVPTHNTFPGGHITCVGANSAASLSSRPIRYLFLDEIDRYPPSAGSEGDPVRLAVQRTRTFVWSKKIVEISSPGIEGVSRIMKSFELSDQRFYYVPCPHCDHYQILNWDHVEWETDEVDGQAKHDPSTAAYRCDHCACLIDDSDKFDMLLAGEWRVTNPEGSFPGFHISALYSPWVTWPELAKEFLEVKDDSTQLQTFINLQLGEPWTELRGDVTPDQLEARAPREPPEGYEVPNGVGYLTAGIDVQDDRLELAIKGWGAGEESWLIGHHRIYGDPEKETVWAKLDTFLTRPYRHESGQTMRIQVSCIDSGHLTTEVYKFVAPRQKRGVHATKGLDQRAKEPLKRTQRKNQYGVNLWSIGTESFKDVVFNRLQLERLGPGYMHFCARTDTGADAEYYAQFGGEIRKREHRGGRIIRYYKQVRANEAIDLEVLALVGLHIAGKAVRETLGERAAALAGDPSPEASGSAKPRRQKSRIRSKGLS